jgi:hypothetical protein
MVELVEPQGVPAESTGGAGEASSAASGGSSSKPGASQMALVNTVFKQCQRLPTSIRAPVIKGVARLGAKWTKYQKSSAEAAAVAARTTDGEEAKPLYSAEQLDAVEKCIRRAVMGKFGIPVAEGQWEGEGKRGNGALSEETRGSQWGRRLLARRRARSQGARGLSARRGACGEGASGLFVRRSVRGAFSGSALSTGGSARTPLMDRGTCALSSAHRGAAS